MSNTVKMTALVGAFGLLAGTVLGLWLGSLRPRGAGPSPQLPPGTTASLESVARYNCEQSGGAFAAEGCQCPQEPAVAGAPAFSYEDATGYCIDPFGIPGGELGEVEKRLQELRMLESEN